MKKNKHLPFNVIVATANGDENAIEKFLSFYYGDISKLSLCPIRDDYGNIYMVIDNELKGMIQTVIMNMIFNFKITVI